MEKASGGSITRKWYVIRPWFVVFVMLGLVGCMGLFRLVNPPQGSGPAGGAVEGEVYRKVWREGPVLLVGMGDSVVTGFGARPGRGFFELLTLQPEDDDATLKGCTLRAVYPDLRIINVAENSSSSGDHLRTQLRRVPKQREEVHGLVVISTGGIDLIHDYGSAEPRDEALYGAGWEEGRVYAQNFRERLEQLLDGLIERFPGGCDIYLATIFDPTDGVGDIENVNFMLRAVRPLPAWPDGLKIHAAFNQHIREAAAARPQVHVVDVHRAMLGHGLHCRESSRPFYDAKDPTYWYYYNLEDPNERGYDAIRRAFLRAMAEGR